MRTPRNHFVPSHPETNTQKMAQDEKMVPTNISKFGVARRYYKRSLLIAVNLVAGLSIFFFGYDQGVMGGVNTTRNYAETMGFGRWDVGTGEVTITKPVLQGGIVSAPLVYETVLITAERDLLSTRDTGRRFARGMAW